MSNIFFVLGHFWTLVTEDYELILILLEWGIEDKETLSTFWDNVFFLLSSFLPLWLFLFLFLWLLLFLLFSYLLLFPFLSLLVIFFVETVLSKKNAQLLLLISLRLFLGTAVNVNKYVIFISGIIGLGCVGGSGWYIWLQISIIP